MPRPTLAVLAACTLLSSLSGQALAQAKLAANPALPSYGQPVEIQLRDANVFLPSTRYSRSGNTIVVEAEHLPSSFGPFGPNIGPTEVNLGELPPGNYSVQARLVDIGGSSGTTTLSTQLAVVPPQGWGAYLLPVAPQAFSETQVVIRSAAYFDPASMRASVSGNVVKLNRQLTPAAGDTVRIRLAGTAGGRAIERQLVAIPMRGTVSKFGNLPPIAGVVRFSRQALPQVRGGCVGTIAFNIWLPVLAPELQRAVDSVASCAGIVIDLRGNPGGVGAMVMGFGGYFVESPVSLGTMRMRDLSLNYAINPRMVRLSGGQSGPFKGPVAILVDAMSASTSEIFATGMQRLGRAKVFGQRSAGAALPALMHGLPSGDTFVHAVADFTDPAGGRIEGAGVTPDQLIPLSQQDLSQNIDAPLDAAVKWIVSATTD
jgi:hypothetical protein